MYLRGMFRLLAGLFTLAAPFLIAGAALWLVLVWLGILEGEVSGWAVIAAFVGVAGLVARIAED